MFSLVNAMTIYLCAESELNAPCFNVIKLLGLLDEQILCQKERAKVVRHIIKDVRSCVTRHMCHLTTSVRTMSVTKSYREDMERKY